MGISHQVFPRIYMNCSSTKSRNSSPPASTGLRERLPHLLHTTTMPRRLTTHSTQAHPWQVWARSDADFSDADESSDDVYMMSLQMSLLMSLQMGSFLFEDLQGQLETYTTLLSLQMMSTRHVPRTSAHNQKSQLYRTSASMQTCARRRGKKGQQNLTIACVRVCVHFHKSSAP